MRKLSLIIALILAAVFTVIVLAQPGDATRGRALFTSKGCNNCHPNGQAGVGPSLVGVTTRRTEAQIRQQITQGGGAMPAYPSTDQEVADLIAFLATLGAQPATPAATATPTRPPTTPTVPAATPTVAAATATPTRPAATPTTAVAVATPTAAPTLPRTGDSSIPSAAIGVAIFGMLVLGAGFIRRRRKV